MLRVSLFLTTALVLTPAVHAQTLKPTRTTDVPTLIANLKQGGEVQRKAIREIMRIGPPARDAVGPLVELLTADAGASKTFVAGALGAIGPDARSKASPVLIGLLDAERSDSIRYLNALTRITIDARDVPRVLRVAASAKSAPLLTHLYANVLATAGVGATSELVKAMSHEQLPIRLMAVAAIGKLGKPAKSPPVEKALRQSINNSQLLVPAAESLVAIGSSAQVAVPALLKALETTSRVDLLRTTEWRYTCPAATALARIPEAIPAVIQHLDHKDALVRIGCLYVLATTKENAAAAIPRLKKMLTREQTQNEVDFVIAALLKLDPVWVQKAVAAFGKPTIDLPPRHLRNLVLPLQQAAKKEVKG